jgi:hypothetical protein
MWQGQLLGDSYGRNVVGAYRAQTDGIETTPYLSSTQVLNDRGDVRTTQFVQQRQLSATFTAADDASPGGLPRMTSIQGGDRWHEDFYGIPRLYFLQDPAGQAAGQKYTSNRYGGSVRGPIRKETTHFVVQYLGIRQSVDRQLEGYVPTGDYRAAVQAAEPRLDSILAAYPSVPRSSASGLSTVFDSTGSQTQSGDLAFVRVDQTARPGSRKGLPDSGFVRFDMARTDTQSPLSGGEGYLRDVATVHGRPYDVAAGWTHPFNADFMQDLRAAFMYSEIESFNHGSIASSYSVSIPGLTGLNGDQETFGRSQALLLQDQLTATRGRHTLQAGAAAERLEVDIHSSDSGRVNFASLAAFSANHVNWATYIQPVPSNALLQWQAFAWLQDNWKIRKNLLIGLGVRYEFYDRPRELDDKAIPFDFATCGATGFCKPGASFNRLNPLNLDPRVSAAWTPDVGPGWLRSRTVLRAGAAIYHSDGLLMDQASPVYNEVQNFYLNSSLNPALSYPVTPFLKSSGAGIASARAASRDRSNPYASEWSVSIQTQPARRWIGTGTYFGATGYHLPVSSYINLIDPASALRPHPEFGQIPYFANAGSSNLHVAAATATYYAPGGTQFMGGYNWAHEIDNDAYNDIGADAPQNPACPRCERASGDLDVRQLGGFRGYYPIGFGDPASPSRSALTRHLLAHWSLLGNFYGASGQPVNVTIDRATSQVATGYTIRQRPDRVPGVSLTPPGGARVSQWINPAAFTSIHGLYGTAGRNIARGPDLWGLSSGLQRDLALPKHVHMRLLAGSANVLNHANYSAPFADWSSPEFGRIITPYSPQRGGDMGPRTFYLDMSFSR